MHTLYPIVGSFCGSIRKMVKWASIPLLAEFSN